ncbi:MAG: DUF1353 domain-containing protein [Pseudomonadota bacterium]
MKLTKVCKCIMLLLAATALSACMTPTETALRETAQNECTDLSNPSCTFQGTPIALSDQPVRRIRTSDFFATLQTVSFTDTKGLTWSAPIRTLTDGASIPALFHPLVGNPTDPEFLNAAVMHDAYCGIGNESGLAFRARSWEETHRMFYDALIASGVGPIKAKTMFAAVYLAGPRWNDAARDMSEVSAQRLYREMEWCIFWITRANPSRDEIITWMRKREAVLKSADHTPPNWDNLL